MGQQGRRAAASKKARNIPPYKYDVGLRFDAKRFCLQDKVLGPRSSSPVNLYLELPCIVKQGRQCITCWMHPDARTQIFEPHKEALLFPQPFQQSHGMIWMRQECDESATPARRWGGIQWSHVFINTVIPHRSMTFSNHLNETDMAWWHMFITPPVNVWQGVPEFWVLFTRDMQAIANWPRPHKFYSQLTVRLKKTWQHTCWDNQCHVCLKAIWLCLVLVGLWGLEFDFTVVSDYNMYVF